MIIRSQNKTMLIPMDKFIIGIYNYQNRHYVALFSLESCDYVASIGEYQSEERSLEVLTSIQSSYENSIQHAYDGYPSQQINGWNENTVYEMPIIN